MKSVEVVDLLHGRAHHFDDADALWRWAQLHAPWALDPGVQTEEDLLDRLALAQNYDVSAAEDDQSPAPLPMDRAVEALGAAHPYAHPALRPHLVRDEGDVTGAALRAYGLEPTKEARETLRMLVRGVKPVESPKDQPLPENTKVIAVKPEGEDVAERVRLAIRDRSVSEAHLGGKHSKGTLFVKTDQGIWLLKPGSGGTSPALGVAQEHVGQAAREAVGYYAFKVLGLIEWVARAELLTIDGRPYAAEKYLSGDGIGPFIDAQKGANAKLRAYLLPLLRDGTLHRLAAADFVLGNPDRHGNNVLVFPMRLIDHGSAFAGPAFDPGQDRNTFTPCYLRFWSPADYPTRPAEERLPMLPAASALGRRNVADWLAGLDRGALEAVLKRYGVGDATLQRFDQLREAAARYHADEAVNRAWTTGV